MKDILLAKRGLTSGVNRESLGMAALSEGGSSDMEGESNGWDAMKKFLSALKNISGELAPDEVANRIIKESCTLVDAERSTLFFIDGNIIPQTCVCKSNTPIKHNRSKSRTHLHASTPRAPV